MLLGRFNSLGPKFGSGTFFFLKIIQSENRTRSKLRSYFPFICSISRQIKAITIKAESEYNQSSLKALSSNTFSRAHFAFNENRKILLEQTEQEIKHVSTNQEEEYACQYIFTVGELKYNKKKEH